MSAEGAGLLAGGAGTRRGLGVCSPVRAGGRGPGREGGGPRAPRGAGAAGRGRAGVGGDAERPQWSLEGSRPAERPGSAPPAPTPAQSPVRRMGPAAPWQRAPLLVTGDPGPATGGVVPARGGGRCAPLRPHLPCGSPGLGSAAAWRARDPAAQASCALEVAGGSLPLPAPMMQGERRRGVGSGEGAPPGRASHPASPCPSPLVLTVQSTPHGGRGGPRVRPLLCGLSLRGWRLCGAPSPQPGRWGQAPADPLRGDGAVLLSSWRQHGSPFPACRPALSPTPVGL